jgi:hypothetical protein
MKPIMIYTMPRTRATAVFFCARRAILKDEVFGYDTLDTNSEDSWRKAFDHVEDPRAVLKIHGRHIDRHPRIIEWYDSVIKKNTYDVFVVERPDMVNVFLSYCMAHRFGFNLRDEIDPFEFSITPEEILHIEEELKLYLKYMPPNAIRITVDSMPDSHFNRKIISSEDQLSHNKYKYIENYEWAKTRIQLLVDQYLNVQNN